MIPQAQKKDIDWYDEFYKHEQTEFTPWYKQLLPELIPALSGDVKLFEPGCGQGKILRYLVENGHILPSNVYANDQSDQAVEFVTKRLPSSRVVVGDIYHLPYADNEFDIILLMETIEHLEDPVSALMQLHKVLKPGGSIYISFPNFFHLPWLMIRIAAETLNRPNWIVLQPVDKIYTTFQVIKYARTAGLKFKSIIGSCFFPPILFKYEKSWQSNLLTKLGLSHLSFHPILRFTK